MALILCIETTSTNCSIALASEAGGFFNNFKVDYCLDLMEDQSDSYSHGELLHVYIKDILDRNQFSTKDLDAVAISKGPGSYTGLRIGIASAKGLCYALNIPLISIDTLQSLSIKATINGLIIPMVDARRMEVYSGVYNTVEQIEEVKAVVLAKESYENYLSLGDVTIIGTGALKFQELNRDTSNVYQDALSTALTMCDLAIKAYNKSDTVKDIAYFEPFYLKEFRSN
jgi:tRNA threonylcarbamoyladenosine biosynthesis protein TsaB